MMRFANHIRDTCIIGCSILVGAMTWTNHPAARSLRAEARVRRCTAQLSEIRKALLAYQHDHGKLPERLGMLHPRYIQDRRVFTCPSALPRIRQGTAGYIVELGGSATASAYLLSYLSEEYEAMRKTRGGLTPLVICDQHVQDVTEETWGQVYSGPAYVRRHGDPPFVVVRLNGQVDRVPLGEVRRRGWRNSIEF